MSVTTTHPDYDKFVNANEFMRDIIFGEERIKEKAIASKGAKYVPALSDQDLTEYKAYVNRPPFENMVGRTLDGMTGLLFSKEATFEAPSQIEDLQDNINLSGQTLTDIAQESAEELLGLGRNGLLVDMTVDGSSTPYMTRYTTESIINWRHENINGVSTLVMVVLKETKSTWTDEFTQEHEDQYRVLKLEDGQYIVRLYTKGNDKDTWNIEELVPKMNGRPLPYIPFVPIAPDTLTIEPKKAPLIDLARVNMAHFKLNVDYYHGMHFTALPTPYGGGVFDDEMGDFKIGSTTIHTFREPTAFLKYLEFEGKGLETLENEKEKLKESMVVLGSNMLQGDKKVAEAENTVAMRNAGSNATLISIADTLSRGITKALNIMVEWGGYSGEATYRINTDYNLTEMSADDVLKLTNSWIQGGISKRDLHYNLVKGERVDAKKDFEEWQSELEEETPTMSVLPPKANNNISDDTLKKLQDKLNG